MIDWRTGIVEPVDESVQVTRMNPGTRANSHFTSIDFRVLVFLDDEHDIVVGGRYLDAFEKRGDDWRIASRMMLYDWYQDWGASVDWTQGVMGMPFSAPHFSGRSHGDYSAQFFGKS